MSFTVRSLLGRVKPFRPDMDRGDVDYILQEAARRVIQESFLGKETKQVFFLPKNVNQICMSPQMTFYSSGAPNLAGTPGYSTYGINYTQMVLPAGGDVDPNNPDQRMPVDIVRINKFRIARPPMLGNDPTFHGYSESIPTSTTGWVAGDFVVMSLHGTGTNTDATTLTWNAGDMMYWDGTKWYVFTSEQFSTVAETNAASFEKNNTRPQQTPATVSYWSQNSGGGGSIDFFDQPAIDGDISIISTGGDIMLSIVTYLWVPTINVPDTNPRIPSSLGPAFWNSAGGGTVTLMCTTSAESPVFEWSATFDKDTSGMASILSIELSVFEGECTLLARGYDESIVDTGINVIATCTVTSNGRSSSFSITIPYLLFISVYNTYAYLAGSYALVADSFEAKIVGNVSGCSFSWQAVSINPSIGSGQGTNNVIVETNHGTVDSFDVTTSVNISHNSSLGAIGSITSIGTAP